MPNTAFYRLSTNQYNSADGWVLAPPRALNLIDGINSVQLFNLEAESSHNIKPQTYLRSDGSLITTHYVFEGNYYLSQNKIPLLLGVSSLEGYINKDIKLQIIMGDYVPSRENPLSYWTEFDTNLPNPLSSNLLTKPYNSNYGYLIELNCRLSMEIEKIEARDRVKLYTKKILLTNEMNTIFKTYQTEGGG